MTDQPIHYAHPGHHTTHSRRAMIGFACAVASACGIVVTMLLIRRPIPGPVGGFTRALAPIFGAVVFFLWLAGLLLGISGLRQPRRLPGFARAALVACGATVLLFGLMILLMY